PAIRLAKAVLRRQGLELHDADQLVLDSHVFRLDRIFEDYVRGFLRYQLSDLSPSYNVLDGNKHPGRKRYFDELPSEDATPDVVIAGLGRERHVPVVIEVKYIDRPPKRDEENQAVAYAVSYRSPKVILVHPRAAGGGAGPYR